MNNQALTLPWAKINSFVGNHTNKALTAHRPCPICDGLYYRTLLVFDDFQYFSDSKEQPKRTLIREVQCQSCQAVYLNPCFTPIGLDYLFKEAGQSYGSTEERPQEQFNWLSIRGLLDEGIKILDVGCYEGGLLSNLPTNLRRIGVDIDASSIAKGQEKYGSKGVELIHGAFETFQCPIEPDVIVMFHVLEHLANPYEVLKHLRSISHNDTRLVIEVPTLEFGKTNDINGFFSVQHMTHFSEHSLDALMARSGWLVLEKQQMEVYNGYRILAKPGAFCVKVAGDEADRLRVFEYFEHYYRNLTEVAKKICSWSNPTRMVIWGGGSHSEFLYQVTPLFQQNPDREYLVVDSDPVKQGKSWRGLPILHPEILKKISWDDCVLLVSSYGGQDSIAKAASILGVPDSAIKKLYDYVNVY